jgi:peptide/nickel transport system substrate-binding protein
LIALLLLVACSQPVGDVSTGSTATPEAEAAEGGEEAEGGEAAGGGELTIAIAEEPDDLDPTLARTLVGRMVFINMCEKLYDVDANLEIVPQLAADLPDVSEDGTSVTIPLARRRHVQRRHAVQRRGRQAVTRPTHDPRGLEPRQ